MLAECEELGLCLSCLTWSCHLRQKTQGQSLPCPRLSHQSGEIQASPEAGSESSMLLPLLIIQKSTLPLIRGKPADSWVILTYFSCLRPSRNTACCAWEVPWLVPWRLPLTRARQSVCTSSTGSSTAGLIKPRNKLPER